MSRPLQPERDTRFLRLYAESEGSIRAFVRSLVPTRQMASEVMQDVILVLWQKYGEALDFKSWSLGVARNVILQHLRRVSRDRHVFDDALVNQLADAAGSRTRHCVCVSGGGRGARPAADWSVASAGACHLSGTGRLPCARTRGRSAAGGLRVRLRHRAGVPRRTERTSDPPKTQSLAGRLVS